MTINTSPPGSNPFTVEAVSDTTTTSASALFDENASVIGLVDSGVTVDGFGLNIESTLPTSTITVTNSGTVSTDQNSNIALNINAGAPGNFGTFTYSGSGNVTNTGSGGTALSVANSGTGDVDVTVSGTSTISATSSGTGIEAGGGSSTGTVMVTVDTGGMVQAGQAIALGGNTTTNTLDNSGTVTGTGDLGVGVAAVVATVTNSGTISGTSEGVGVNDLTLTNNSGATIETTGTTATGAGEAAIVAVEAVTSANITNKSGATIEATGPLGQIGILVTGDAMVDNAGTISGPLDGINTNTSGNTTITNSGSITATTRSGIRINTATIENDEGGTVSGLNGIFFRDSSDPVNSPFSASSVFDDGTITGTGATSGFSTTPIAIHFSKGSTGNTLTLGTDSVIDGNVLGAGSDILQLGGTGSANFDVSNIGAAAQYEGFSTFNKIDTSTWTLTGTGANGWTVEQGTLQVDGTIGDTTVQSGGVLDGTGTTGALTVDSGGTLAPGDDPGTLTTGNLDLPAGSTLSIEIEGASPGVGGFSQVVADGSVTLGGTLSTTLLNGFIAQGGESFEIINNESNAAVSGTFTGLSEGAKFTLGGTTLSISYVGGDGNDVVLTEVNIPPTLALGATVASWTEEQAAATTLSPTVTITDPDNLDLVSATVAITGGTFAGDQDTLSATATGNISVSYNSSTETLTLTGSDTLANYQTVLDSVTFNAGENPTDFGADPSRTLVWTVDDGGGTAAGGSQIGTATSTVDITNVNDPPTLNVGASVAAGSSTVTLSPNVTITDPDDQKLLDATVQITGGRFAGDVLAATATGNITVSYNSSTETLLLTGTDTLANYQTVLDSVTFHSTAPDPTNGGANSTRTISWVVQDPSGTLNGGSDTSTPQTETLSLDQPATLSGLTQTASWTEEQAFPTTLSPNVTITDGDGVNTELSATVKIVGGTFSGDQDVLSATATGNITVGYDSSTETLTLTGSDSLANYQTVLDSVTFHAGENPTDFGSNPSRTLAWTVADHLGNESGPISTTINITNVNDPPTLASVPTLALFVEESSIKLAPTVSLTDPDNLTLASATVRITGGTFAGDSDLLTETLSFPSIAATYNSATETLTLTGSDTLLDYQIALENVVFSAGENPTNFGSNPSRTVVWTLNDGGGSNNLSTVTETVTVVNVDDPPTLALGVTVASWTEEQALPASLAPAVTATDPDNLTLASATVKITGGTFLGDGDVLSATSNGAITVSYNSTTETLTLTGSDTLAHYQSVLDSVTFQAGENPTDFDSNPTRTLAWLLNDGTTSSGSANSTINLTNVNDPPTLGSVAPTAFFTEEHPAVTLSSSVSVTDPDNLDLVSATVQITGGTFAGDGDTLAATATGNIAVSYNSSTETLTLTGTDTLAHYQTVLDSITFFTLVENPTNFGSNPTRTVVWTLNDGGGTANGGAQISAPVTSTIDVFNVNDAPTLNVAPSASFTEEGGAVTLSNAVSIVDVDDLNLSGATVQITSIPIPSRGDVLAATVTGTSITASYNSSTETLTLSGTDTLAHYRQVLDTVTFNAGENPTNFGFSPTRTVTWTLMDPSGTANGGVNVSTPVTSIVSITNVNDPPTLSNVAASAVVTFPGQTVAVSPATSVSDPDNLTLANATVQITGGTFAGDGDVLAAATKGTGITASYNSTTETLTLTDSDTLADYALVLDSVTFDSTSTNPTNSGADRTRTVTWTANDGSGSNNVSAPAVTTISFQGAVPFDLNGDAISDLVFQNNGTPGIWLWNGSAPTAEVALTNPGASWHIITSRDVNGDGKADLIWQNDNGTPGIWLMNGTTPLAEVGLTNPGPTWKLVAAGDVNGDGNADLIWQNSDGTLGVWEMNGTTPIAEAAIGNPGANWKVVGAADFNGDGKDDILLQNSVTGNLMIDLMNGTTIASSVSITVGDPSWHAVSTGEFNGQAEIAWQNNNGQVGIWLMNGTAPVAEAALSNPGAGWQLLSIDHFTPNGQADLLFQNTNGAMMLWEMNGTSVAAMVNLPNPTAAWQSVNGHPFATG